MSKRKTQEEIIRLEEELKKREEDKALTGYRPRSFHYSFITSPDRIKLFVGSNQSGKTLSVCQEIIACAIGYRPWIRPFADAVAEHPENYPWAPSPEEILKHRRIGRRVPTMSIVVGLDFQSSVANNIFPKIKEIIGDKYFTKVEYSQGKIPSKIYWKNESTTLFLSCEQDTFRFEGLTADLAVFDEPPPQDKWVALHRGLLVKKGTALFSMTPLAEPWIFDTLLADAQKAGESVHLSTCDLFSDEVDWMDVEDKESFRREVERKNPHEVEARIHGRFSHLMGRIFPTYDAKVHVIAEDKKPINNKYTLGMTVDPHDRKPFAISWWMVDSTGALTFIREWPLTPFHEMRSCDKTVDDYCKLFKEVEDEIFRTGMGSGAGEAAGLKVTYRFMDPNSGPKRNVLTGQTLVDEFAKNGFYFDTNINDSLQDGHEAVRDYLSYDEDKPVGFTNTPKLFIYDNCWNMNHCFERYVWDDKRSSDVIREKPQEKFKDFIDTCRYTCIKRPIMIESGADKVWSPDVDKMRSLY